MDKHPPKRRRQKYSKLICLGCRARRIKCTLPDSTITASAQPQPLEKACHRCRQNNIECIVDYTTLGRPSRQHILLARPSSAGDETTSSAQLPDDAGDADDDDAGSPNVEHFILTQSDGPNTGDATITIRNQRPSKSEMSEALVTPFALFSALLSRDKRYARALKVPPVLQVPLSNVVDAGVVDLLDKRLVWHRLFYPDIPSLSRLRESADVVEPETPSYIATSFLLALLCDFALDVPGHDLGAYQHLRPILHAMSYHSGQKLLFTLPKHPYTVLGLELAAEYQPLLFTSSQSSAPTAIKAAPYITLAQDTAMELGYDVAGARLSELLHDQNSMTTDCEALTHECVHWIRLSVAKDSLDGGMLGSQTVRSKRQSLSVQECLEALHTAVTCNAVSIRALLAYTSAVNGVHRARCMQDIVVNWRDLDHIGKLVNHHTAECEEQKDRLMRALTQRVNVHADIEASTILHIADMQAHSSHVNVTGQALFFAIMAGALGASQRPHVQPADALDVSDDIIETLLAHDKDDPRRSDHRRFLEDYGGDRSEQMTRVLTNFVTAADTLKLDGLAYIGLTRQSAGIILYTCKEIVETNAARLKGWGGLDDNVDVQMILFNECARRLESMKYGAGTDEAMANGCLLTATAKLVRSLHSVLQGFKKSATLLQLQQVSSGSSHPDPTPDSNQSTMQTGLDDMSTQDWDVLQDDPFEDWENWPQFNPFDFTDLFGDGISWELSDLGQL